MFSETTQLLVVTIGYLLILILWGIYQGKKVRRSEDYSIAGRNLPGWVAALSERATGESSWALLGLPGAAYATGLLEIWTALGCVAGIITAWSLLAWRLRREADRYKANTYTDYLANRHPESQQGIRVVASLTITFFFFFYIGAQFLGGGKTLFTMFGLRTEYGMLLTALIILPYTIYGGFRSVVYTDVIQALVMITTLVVGPIVGFIYLAENPDLYAPTIDKALNMAGPGYRSLLGPYEGFMAGIVIAGGFSWFFGYLGGQPQLSMRFMAIRNHRQARVARNIGILWTILAYTGALTLGWIGLAIFGPEGLNDQEHVMPSVLLKIFPPAIAAVLITGAIAAMISTADSLLVLSANELSENIVKPLLKNSSEERKSLWHSRMITTILAIIALILAYISPQNLIFTLVSYVWAGIGGTFSVVILLTLFWRHYHGKAVIVTIIAGMLFTVIWISTGMDKIITSRLLTFFVALITGIISALLIQKPEPAKPMIINSYLHRKKQSL